TDLELSQDGSRCAVFTRVHPKMKQIRPEVRVFDARSGAEVCRLAGPAAGVSEVAFRSDGGRVTTGGADGTVTVWDAESGEQLWTVRGSDEPVVGLAFGPDGGVLAALASRAAYE